MLLINDGRRPSSKLHRDLSLVKPCRVTSLYDVTATPRETTLIVCDVDLVETTNALALRASIARNRGTETPILFLVGEPIRLQTTQAHALAATSVMRHDAPRPLLLARVTQLISHPGFRGASNGKDQLAHRGTIDAGIALAELLDRAEMGQAVSHRNVVEASNAVLTTVRHTSIRHWTDVLWTHDAGTYQHCLLVAGLVVAFSMSLGFRQADIDLLSQAAILHDIGKAQIPAQLLNKPGALTPEETRIIRAHPDIGSDLLLSQGGFDRQIVDVVRHHHELLDGSGYPDGLAGYEVSDVVRMTTICDIFAALIEHRPYRSALSVADAFKLMSEMKGKLDFSLLRAFHKVVDDLGHSRMN